MIWIISLFGLVVGSFINVCIHRIPRNESIVRAPSHCVECGAKIKPYDLIPLISYIILLGKCRSCKSTISFRYPSVELLNAALWAAVYAFYGLSVNAVFYMILCSTLIAVAFIDYKSLIIPDGILIFILIFGIFFNIINLDKYTLINSAAGFLVISIPLLLISLATKGGIGGGDIKLMAVCGLYLGAKLVTAGFFLGMALAAVISVVLLALKRKKKGDLIPLGPFLSTGMVLSVFAGESLVEWYLNFFIS